MNGWMPKDPTCMEERTATAGKCCPADNDDHSALMFTPGGLPCCVAGGAKKVLDACDAWTSDVCDQQSAQVTRPVLKGSLQQLFGLPPFQNSGPPWHLAPIVINYKYEPAKRKEPPTQALQADKSNDNSTFAPGYPEIPSSPDDVLLYPRRAASVWVHAGMNDAPGTTLDQQRIALNLLQPEIERKQKDLEMEFHAAQTGLSNFTNSENVSVHVVNAPLAVFSVMQRSKAMIDEIKNWSSENRNRGEEKNLTSVDGDNSQEAATLERSDQSFLKDKYSQKSLDHILKSFHDVRYHGMTYVPVFIPDSQRKSVHDSPQSSGSKSLARPQMRFQGSTKGMKDRQILQRVKKIVQRLKRNEVQQNTAKPKPLKVLSTLTASEAEKIHEIAEKLQKSSKQDAFRSAVHNLEKAENDLVSAMTQNHVFHKQLVTHLKRSAAPRMPSTPSITASTRHHAHKVNMLEGDEQNNQDGDKDQSQSDETPRMYPEDEHVGSWYQYDRSRHLKRLALEFCHGQFVTRHEVMFCLRNLLRSPDKTKQEASLRNDEVNRFYVVQS